MLGDAVFADYVVCTPVGDIPCIAQHLSVVCLQRDLADPVQPSKRGKPERTSARPPLFRKGCFANTAAAENEEVEHAQGSEVTIGQGKHMAQRLQSFSGGAEGIHREAPSDEATAVRLLAAPSRFQGRL